jgi:hypothetical protein
MNARIKAADKASVPKPEASAARGLQTECVSSYSSPCEQLMHLQRTVGNQAVHRLLDAGFVQAKLTIDRPGDIHEQEADRVADQVMQMPGNTAVHGRSSAVIGANDRIPIKPT